MSLLIGAATALLLTAIADVTPDLQTVCAAPTGQTPRLGGVSIRDEPAVDGDLAFLRVTSDESGAFMKVYYDAGSEAAARSRAACLGAQLALLERETGDLRQDAEWWSAVFTQDPDYRAPRSGPDFIPRWTVLVQADGQIPASGHMTVVNTMPHEQVHAYQARAAARLPRWLAEGHASWIQRLIAAAFDPEVEKDNLHARATAAATSSGSLNLARWGTRRPKREAVMRQVSSEDRARMQADPNFHPVGVFTFRDDDWEGEVVNPSGLYMAATAVFQGLEARHGEEAVRAWMAELTAQNGPVSPTTVAASVQRHFGESIDDLLAERPLSDLLAQDL